jgi:hypothetical protein
METNVVGTIDSVLLTIAAQPDSEVKRKDVSEQAPIEEVQEHSGKTLDMYV